MAEENRILSELGPVLSLTETSLPAFSSDIAEEMKSGFLSPGAFLEVQPGRVLVRCWQGRDFGFA